MGCTQHPAGSRISSGRGGQVGASKPVSHGFEVNVEAILAMENLLFLRSIAAPTSRLSNARTWVKWSTRFRTHEWK